MNKTPSLVTSLHLNIFQCNLCDGDQYCVIVPLKPQAVVACRKCGLRTWLPFPSAAEVEVIYQSEAYRHSQYFLPRDIEKTTRHYLQQQIVCENIVRRFGIKAQVLEIGPGQGHFLELCRERSIQADAVELSAPLAKTLRSFYGGTILELPLEQLNLPGNAYDVVAAFDVVEHCLNPKIWLAEIWRILRPGGMFALSTISVDNALDTIGLTFARTGIMGPARRLYPPFHLFYFTPNNVVQYLSCAGFKIERHIFENYDVRKASQRKELQLALALIYFYHNIIGRKTNQYVWAVKPK